MRGREVMDSKMVFSAKAEKYAKYRWEYAASAIETIINITQMSIHSIVADIGAGTGKLMKHFVAQAQKIYAIESNLELRQILTVLICTFIIALSTICMPRHCQIF
jgi:16S rRNA A1518/A1519 N6-dimethyltransferase RsmA/KsgA/DIM1 with predicted DNA glycosylase/AP lyase activity